MKLGRLLTITLFRITQSCTQEARTIAQDARKELEKGKKWSAEECAPYEKEAAEQLALLQDKLNQAGANEAYAKAVKVLRGMGFKESQTKTPTASLSGP